MIDFRVGIEEFEDGESQQAITFAHLDLPDGLMYAIRATTHDVLDVAAKMIESYDVTFGSVGASEKDMAFVRAAREYLDTGEQA